MTVQARGYYSGQLADMVQVVESSITTDYMTDDEPIYSTDNNANHGETGEKITILDTILEHGNPIIIGLGTIFIIIKKIAKKYLG